MVVFVRSWFIFQLNLPDGASEEDETNAWLDQIKPLWKQLEKLGMMFTVASYLYPGVARYFAVADGELMALGVADLELDALRALHAWAPAIKPTINHYNTAACCAVCSVSR